ncbi:MAG: hypothetical protein ABJC19_02055 [Gemmatimonadota bacterium]
MDHPVDPLAPLLVWVLVPHLETSDPNLTCYNDYSQSHAEFDRVFARLGLEWRWEQVTLDNAAAVLDRVVRESVGRTPVVFNLCDGDEQNSIPGVSVIHQLERLGLCYTGADARFYQLTTSKIVMKEAFDAAAVATPMWEVVPEEAGDDAGIIARLGSPLIVKPAVSAGSMGLTVKSVVHDAGALRREVAQLHEGYRGWRLADGGVIAERFITGREFTTFIVGSVDAPEQCLIYPPVERVFHRDLPPTEQFLSFDRLWEIYEREAPLGVDAYLWEYAEVAPPLATEIEALSWRAYAAVGGSGYGRVDLRLDAESGSLQVLEVNSQCGLSEDEDYTSIGAILRFAGRPFSEVIEAVVQDALRAWHPAVPFALP